MNEILDYCIKVNVVRSYFPIHDQVEQNLIEPRPDMNNNMVGRMELFLL